MLVIALRASVIIFSLGLVPFNSGLTLLWLAWCSADGGRRCCRTVSVCSDRWLRTHDLVRASEQSREAIDTRWTTDVSGFRPAAEGFILRTVSVCSDRWLRTHDLVRASEQSREAIDTRWTTDVSVSWIDQSDTCSSVYSIYSICIE